MMPERLADCATWVDLLWNEAQRRGIDTAALREDCEIRDDDTSERISR
jgi:hypothetical protein